jgi:hypothetical protein
MGLKTMGMRGSVTFGLQRWVNRGKICRNMHLGENHRSEGGNMGIEGFNMGSEVLFDVLHFGIYGGVYVFIDGGNIGTDLSHFLLGFSEIIVQGIEVSSLVLAMGVGHDGEGKRQGTGGATQKMGYG